MIASSDPESARRRIAELDWWHTIEVAPGVVTAGGWDLRGTADAMPWPGPLDGLRCLDIGTMDGFWAFELERRGAGEVVATDVLDPARFDRPARNWDRPLGSRPRPFEQNFALAAELLGSKLELRDLSVYDLDPAEHGEFDVVVMGYVLQMLRDPLRALEAIRGVCRGHLLLLDTISLPLELLPSPLARLDARHGALEWFVFNRRGLRKALELTGWVVEETTGVLRDRTGMPGGEAALPFLTRASYKAGILGRSAAIRARPLTP
jgi:tRNA (mo5U34)-methyltransferase